MSCTVTRNGKVKTVKNLGWLLSHWKEVKSFTLTRTNDHLPKPAAMLVVNLRDYGGKYETDFASYSVCLFWLNRPVFRTVPIVLDDGTETTVGSKDYERIMERA